MLSSLSYAHGTSSTPLLGETLGENLRRTVKRFGDREALVVRTQGYRATYRELWDVVGRAARGLMALGVAKGDRVGLWSPNRWEWVVLQYATARAGAVLVNLNPAYKTAEIAYALRQSKTSVLFIAAKFRLNDYVAMTVTGKVQKFRMREMAVAELGLEQVSRQRVALESARFTACGRGAFSRRPGA